MLLFVLLSPLSLIMSSIYFLFPHIRLSNKFIEYIQQKIDKHQNSLLINNDDINDIMNDSLYDYKITYNLLTKKHIDNMEIIDKNNDLYMNHICVLCTFNHEYETLVITQCNHIYSKECLMNGINKIQALCPICRCDLVE